MIRIASVFAALALMGTPASTALAQGSEPSTEAEALSPSQRAAARLLAFIDAIDETAQLQGNGALFTVEGLQLQLVFDTSADRMRVMLPITAAADLDAEQLQRLMQANFDSALDARYAIAQGAVWAVFLHPLSSLTTEDFASGIGQSVNLSRTFGTTFHSGAGVFGGGDSAEENRKLVDDLIAKGRAI
ncbi:MAG: hypothetical protein AAGI03_03655 [Pseudomonadota bacterium]